MTRVSDETVRAWLTEFLATPRENGEVKREADAQGITAHQLREARRTLGVLCVRSGRRRDHGSSWMLPVAGGGAASVLCDDPRLAAFVAERERRFRAPLPHWPVRCGTSRAVTS